MGDESHDIVSNGLREHLTRVWRYGLVLSGDRDVPKDELDEIARKLQRQVS